MFLLRFLKINTHQKKNNNRNRAGWLFSPYYTVTFFKCGSKRKMMDELVTWFYNTVPAGLLLLFLQDTTMEIN